MLCKVGDGFSIVGKKSRPKKTEKNSWNKSQGKKVKEKMSTGKKGKLHYFLNNIKENKIKHKC